MSDLLTTLERPDHIAARMITAQLVGDTPITRKNLNAAMNAGFGGTDADGCWTQRDSFEVLEHALALHLAARPYALTQLADIAQATALMERLPTQTVRSEDQVALQQFSTPVDIAALAVLLAAIGADDLVLEPSAGNGLLVAQAPVCGGLQLNELDPTRRARLASIFPDAIITGGDGAGLVAHHAALPRPSVVLMNPPFSRSLGRGADDLAAARHLQAAIRRTTKAGRIVAIMPDWFAPSARLRAVYESVLANCTVRVSLRLEHCYRKHGTEIAVRLYVIDKAPGNVTPVTIQRGAVADFLCVATIPERLRPVSDTPIVMAPSARPCIALFGAARAVKTTLGHRLIMAQPNPDGCELD